MYRKYPPTSSDIDALIEKIEQHHGSLDLMERLILLPSFTPKSVKKSCVYALKMNNGTVKIGVSKDVDFRANTVSKTAGLQVLNIHQTAPAVNAYAVESACHKTFNEYRTNGEYFKITFAADENYSREVQKAWDNYFRLYNGYCLPKSQHLKKFDVKSMFIQSEYTDAKGEKRLMYYMNRDGFLLLAMGFTGKKALEFKLRFIAEFNRMEQALKPAKRQ